MSINTAPRIGADYLPARMLNEFVYCPRLFYYEHVENVFAHNRETVEGSLLHSRADSGSGELTPAEWLDDTEEASRRSVMLASDTHRLIAKLDVIEVKAGSVTPVDYKRGRPATSPDGSLTAWDADKAQVAAQALVLRDNGYRCDEAILYYATTRQRVRILIDDRLINWALRELDAARYTAVAPRIPPPLVDSPKCPRCSLVGICLPNETHAIDENTITTNPQKPLFPDVEFWEPPFSSVVPKHEVRRLIPARDDLRPLYLNTQGLRVGKSGAVLKMQFRDEVVEQVRIKDICQLNLFGGIQVTTQAIQTLCEHEVPIAYFSQGGWFYGVTHGLGMKNVALRREQFRATDRPRFCLHVASQLVAGKIRNQRTLLQRNHIEPPGDVLRQMKWAASEAERAESLAELLGIEGNAARLYFGNFQGMVKSNDEPWSEDNGKPLMAFRFATRNRRPPRDPVNALLSLAYSVLAKDLTIVCNTVGFDPYVGFYHQPRFGRAPLALDLMEPFRPLIADSAVLSAINTKMVQPEHFVRAGQAVSLTPAGRKAFFRAFEQRMDTLVTHPLFDYRVSYRRMLEIQTRLLARFVTGEHSGYPVFTTR